MHIDQMKFFKSTIRYLVFGLSIPAALIVVTSGFQQEQKGDVFAQLTATGLQNQVVYAQVLDRDVEAPGLNGTASTEPPAVSIDISPLEPLPINGTVIMSLEDVVDTNMNEIPPQGVTVIISNEAVTVTNNEVTIEEPETE